MPVFDTVHTLDALRRDFLLEEAPAPIAYVDEFRPSPVPAVIAIGAFDGVHRGHLALLDLCVRDARARGVRSVAVTFDPDPDTVVSAAPAPKLLTRADRLRALAASGVDEVLVVPFTRDLAAMDHEAFFTQVLAPALFVQAVHVGSDFRLGARGASTVEVIRAWGEVRGIEVFGHDLVLDTEDAACQVVSASHIRTHVAEGKLDAAARMLGRSYMVRGHVVHGRGEGSQMGFPTANIARDELIQMPADGVYAGWALVRSEDGAPIAYPTAINVGLPPMFAHDPASATLEATLLGFHGDLYGKEVCIQFDRMLRPPVHFASRDALIEAVHANIEEVRAALGDEARRL